MIFLVVYFYTILLIIDIDIVQQFQTSRVFSLVLFLDEDISTLYLHVLQLQEKQSLLSQQDRRLKRQITDATLYSATILSY